MASHIDTAEAASEDTATTANRQSKSEDRINLETFRYWENTELESIIANSVTAPKGTVFTVMSYNILAQDLLEKHSYLYSSHTKEALVWERRLDLLVKEIFNLKPDILCLQELQQDYIEVITNRLQSLNLNYVFKRKTGGLQTDGCAIFFNRNIFNEVERQTVEYFQPNIERLDRENVAVILKLSLKSKPNEKFLVATTHLLYNPRRQDVRLAQIQVLLAELDRLSITDYGQKRIPIILTGDFNLQPHSAPYRLLTKGKLYYNNLTHNTLENPTDSYSRLMGNRFISPKLGITDKCQHFDLLKNNYKGNSRLKSSENTSNRDDSFGYDEEDLLREFPYLFSSGCLSHKLNLTSVYKHEKLNGQFEGSTFQEKWVTVDYIFYSRDNSRTSEESKLKLVSRYYLPSVDECHLIGKIPNQYFGSDHLSLAAKFFLQS